MAGDKTIAVGLGELHSSKDSDTVLVAYGLGSCIGIAVYDPVVKAGALAHVMLPEPPDSAKNTLTAKFATMAVPMLVETTRSLGCLQSRLVWKIVGGAQVLSVPGMNGKLQIGERNTEMVKKTMQQHGIRIAAEETGGRSGRTMQLFIGSGKVTVRAAGGVERAL